jgi:pimeloyl-ACP methyl ester carboxylesterase
VVTKPLAFAVGDLLLYAKNNIPVNLTWNNQLFLVGYSEGGYVTMAGARKIQNNIKYKNVFKVTAAAPMAGPHDLTGVMIPLMLREQPYHEGVYLPMTLRGYHAVYGDIFAKETTLKPEYQNLWQLVNGFYSAEDVNEAMPAIPREILKEDFITKIVTIGNPAHEALADNNLCHWQPKMPLHLYHAPNDDLVPFQNSINAALGCHVPLIPIWPLPIPDIGPINTVHAKAFLPCMFAAYAWFYTFRN